MKHYVEPGALGLPYATATVVAQDNAFIEACVCPVCSELCVGPGAYQEHFKEMQEAGQ